MEVPLELVARTVPLSPGSWQSLLGPGHLNIPEDRHWSLYLDSLCQYPPPRRKSRLSSLLARSETSKRLSEAARPPFAQETDVLATLALLFLRTSKLGGKRVEGLPSPLGVRRLPQTQASHLPALYPPPLASPMALKVKDLWQYSRGWPWKGPALKAASW